MIFEPHSDLEKIPAADRVKGAAALRVSVQHKYTMCNEDDTAHCCLCVLERALNGAKFENYAESFLGSDISGIKPYETPCGQILENLIASMTLEIVAHSFSTLNDDHLTHPQIADLLDGLTVDTDDDKWKVAA